MTPDRARRRFRTSPAAAPLLIVLTATLLLVGCRQGPALVPATARRAIDRRVVEYPTGFELQPFARGLTAPAAVAFDNDGNILVAEGATRDSAVRIFGFRPNGTQFQIYPVGRQIPFVRTFRVHAPIGGMVVHQGRIYVSHRDADDKGVITSFDYEGNHRTVVASLPAQGDHALTDLAIHPNSGRIFFGLGSATNSGVVGLDNWQVGWVRKHPHFCDIPFNDLRLLGYRFDTPNPIAGLFGPGETAVTAPFQPFGMGNKLRIDVDPASVHPTAAIYSVDPAGGGLQVVAHGIRYPRGLAFDEYGRLFATNDGMQLRGTRPVQDDPDSLLRIVAGNWYGFPDFTTDLRPISDLPRPPQDMLLKSGYPELSSLVDHQASGLMPPGRSTLDRDSLLRGSFQPLSGAAKLDFVRAGGAFKEFEGSAIVALAGDEAPFATSGKKLVGPIGYKLVRVDVESRQVRDFVRNTEGAPASRLRGKPEALERPVDVKFGPDGSLYIVDMGRVEYKNGNEEPRKYTGRIFRLVAAPSETNTPATRPAE